MHPAQRLVVVLVVGLAVVLCGVRQVAADCDRNGLCVKLMKIISGDASLCDSEADCVRPQEPDCVNDGELSNAFSCDGADCIEVQSMATSVADCAEMFPRTKGTVLERHGEHDFDQEFADQKLKLNEGKKPTVVQRDGLMIFDSTAT